MRRPDHIAVVGMGASTPVGASVWASVAAARAGLCGFREHPFMIDSAGEPMRVAAVPGLDPVVEGVPRYGALLRVAIAEAIAPIESYLPHAVRLCVLLALPPSRPGASVDLARSLALDVRSQWSCVSDVIAYECGHAGGYLALDAAMRALRTITADACVVAGVDSYLAPLTLEWLDANEQLHGAGAFNNAWGFIPGEAAGALLLMLPHAAERLGLEVFGHIAAVGLGTETKLIKTDAVCIGEGLTTAFRAALASVETETRIDNVICDLNGETYRADEYGFTVLRTKNHFREATDFVAPADCWGDIGAASAPLHIAQALIAARKGYARGALSMTWASPESGERGAAIVCGTMADER